METCILTNTIAFFGLPLAREKIGGVGHISPISPEQDRVVGHISPISPEHASIKKIIFILLYILCIFIIIGIHFNHLKNKSKIKGNNYKLKLLMKWCKTVLAQRKLTFLAYSLSGLFDFLFLATRATTPRSSLDWQVTSRLSIDSLLFRMVATMF